MTLNIAAIFGTDDDTIIRAPVVVVADDPVVAPDLPVAPPIIDNPAPVHCCGPHNDPAGWKYSPDKYGRTGWRTASCKRCGSFIGYQRPQ